MIVVPSSSPSPGLDLAKRLDWPELIAVRASWRSKGRIAVWTNGCFDLFHAGHLRSLMAARRFGDILIVGVNSDASVRRLKGNHRPIVSEAERVELLCGLACVDHVVVFDEPTPEQALARLQPDVHCKGADYAPPHGKPIPEAALVKSYGGRVEFLPLVDGLSTSTLIERIRALPK